MKSIPWTPGNAHPIGGADLRLSDSRRLVFVHLSILNCARRRAIRPSVDVSCYYN